MSRFARYSRILTVLLTAFFAAVLLRNDLFAQQTDPGDPPSSSEETADDLQDGNEKPNPYFERLVSPDRTVQRRYDQAMRLIQAGRFAESAQLLGSILEASGDYFVPPLFSGEKDDPAARTTNLSFSDLVLKTLLGLSSQGRESYKLQYETQASRLLETAIEQGSFEGLQRISKNYFPTTAGATATFLIGTYQFESGDWESALLTLQRLDSGDPVNRVDSAPFEPMFSLMTATCQLRLKQADRAKETVERFLKHFPEPRILLAGQTPWPPRTTEEIIARLEQSLEVASAVPVADWLERTGWFLTQGTASQNAETLAGKPLLEPVWAIPSLNQPIFADQATQLLKIVKDAGEAYLPAARPLVVQDRLIMRGLDEMTAVDTQTGKRLWSVPEPEYRVPPSVQAMLPFRMNFRRLATIPQSHRFALRLFFWHDRITHQMSSDGERVFAVEGLDPLPMTSYIHWGRGRRNMQIGNRSIEDPRLRVGNTLVARDVETGRTLWRLGKYPYAQKIFDRLFEEYRQSIGEAASKKPSEKEERDSAKNHPEQKEQARPGAKREDSGFDSLFTEEDLLLSEMWFLGAPLPLHGRLYQIAEHTGVLRLLVLDAETGKLTTQLPLVLSPTPFENDWLRRYYGLTPSASGGILICPTGLGMVAAVDSGTATPLWCFSYLEPSQEEPNNRNPMRQTRFFNFGTNGSNDEFRNMFAATGWQVPSVMIDDGRVLIAPPDVPALYCLDLLTGKLLWKQDDFHRNDALYVACIRNGTAFVVTPVSLSAFSMRTGEPVWRFVRSAASATAKGEIRPNTLPVPLPGQKREERAEKRAEEQAAAKAVDDVARPKLVFPRSLRPVGVGVHHSNRYFLPLSDGHLGIVDLDGCALELIPSSQVQAKNDIEPESVSPEPDDEIAVEESVEIDGMPFQPFQPVMSSRSSSLYGMSSSRDDLIGNLVGIRGHFYSQVPLQVVSFDQWDSLRRRTEALLDESPDNPAGLLQLGRIRLAEGDLAQAVSLFRRSLQGKRTELAADCLRKTLLEGLRNDYPVWSTASQELEGLAEFPEELGEILFVLAQGALDHDKADELIDALKKTLRLEIDHSVVVPVDAELDAQLHRALGSRIERWNQADREHPSRERLQRLAEQIFERFAGKTEDEILPELKLARLSEEGGRRFLVRPWWEQDSLLSSGEIHRWRIFREVFETFPIAKRIDRVLMDLYAKSNLFVPLEMMVDAPVLMPWPDPPNPVPPSESETPEKPAADSKPEPTPPSFPKPLPPIDDVRYLAELSEANGNVADAVYYYRLLQTCYGKAGEKLSSEAMRHPAIREYADKTIVPVSWPDGEVLFEEGEAAPSTTHLERQNPHGWAAARILQNVRSRNRHASSRIPLTWMDSYEPFLTPYAYSMETSPQDAFLVCRDALGKETWRFDLSSISGDMPDYGYFSGNHNHARHGFSEQTVYLKGCNHLLLFVRGNLMIAFDTFRAVEEGEPRILWTKTITDTFPLRQELTAVPLNMFSLSGHSGIRYFPKESVFLSPRIVCYRDAGRVYGLDPVTGRTVWMRHLDSSVCSIMGDRQHLFLVFPETLRAVAVDPASGTKLAEGAIPPGGIFASGTHLVFLERQPPIARSRNETRRLLAADLRDLLYQPLKTASRASDSGPAAKSSIPTYSIREGLSGDTLARLLFCGRFLATVSWETKTLQIYDIHEKRDLLGPPGDWGRRTGVKLPEPTIRNVRGYDSDFDVELFDDKLLVLFAEKRNVDSSQKNVTEEGIAFKRSRGVVTGVPLRSVGSGVMMLYDFEGNPCWNEPARIKDWFRLIDVSERSPIALFALSVNDQETKGVHHFSTALLGIDKRTGRQRFNVLVPTAQNRQQAVLQGFRVTLAPEQKEIAFVAPNRTVHAQFTDRPAASPDPSAERAAPFDGELFHRAFQFFHSFGH